MTLILGLMLTLCIYWNKIQSITLVKVGKVTSQLYSKIEPKENNVTNVILDMLGKSTFIYRDSIGRFEQSISKAS